MKFYAHPDYSHSYSIINYATGEVYTYSANSGRIALKNALKRFYHILRDARLEGYDAHLELYNSKSGTLLAKESYEVPPLVKKCGFKSEVELMATVDAILDEYQAEADADPSWRERL